MKTQEGDRQIVQLYDIIFYNRHEQIIILTNLYTFTILSDWVQTTANIVQYRKRKLMTVKPDLFIFNF